MSRVRLFRCLFVSFLLLAAFSSSAGAADLEVENVKSGDELRYPVALLRGHLGGAEDAPVFVTNNAAPRAASTFVTRLFKGRFRALIELVPGANEIALRCGQSRVRLTLRYRPMTTPYVARMIYLTDSTGDTTYQTQKTNDIQDYKARLDTVAKLMQTFTAERLNDLGFGRKTFSLEFDKNGKVVVHVVKAPHEAAYYHQKDGNALWSEINAFLTPQFPTEQGKNIVIMAFSRFDPATKKPLAHTALGGGGLALFSNLGLFTWPDSLQDVTRAFADVTPADGSRIHDDSAFRSTLWGIASTTIGATLHELGHTFGLPHSNDPLSIMSRGFDHFNRAFMLVEPASKVNAERFAIKDEQVPYFDKPMAETLVASPWFQPDK